MIGSFKKKETFKVKKIIQGELLGAINIDHPAMIHESTGNLRKTSKVVAITAVSNEDVEFETQNTRYKIEF